MLLFSEAFADACTYAALQHCRALQTGSSCLQLLAVARNEPAPGLSESCAKNSAAVSRWAILPTVCSQVKVNGAGCAHDLEGQLARHVTRRAALPLGNWLHFPTTSSIVPAVYRALVFFSSGLLFSVSVGFVIAKVKPPLGFRANIQRAQNVSSETCELTGPRR